MRGWTVVAAMALVACGPVESTGDNVTEKPKPPLKLPATGSFAISNGTGRSVVRIECGKGECFWEEVVGAHQLVRSGDGLRVTIRSRVGSTAHPDFRYPETWSPKTKIEWRYVQTELLCSMTRPSMLRRDDDGQFLFDAIKLDSPPGFQVAAANEYMLFCHDLAPGKWDASEVKRLGYGLLKSDQKRYATERDGLAAMAGAD